MHPARLLQHRGPVLLLLVEMLAVPCCAMLCHAVPPHATLSTSALGDPSGGLRAAGSSSSRRGQGSERHQRGLAGGSRQRGDHMAARWD